MRRLGVVVILALLLFAGVVRAETGGVITINEGQSVTLQFTNPTDADMTIQVQNLDYPASKVPLWISPTTIPANSTVSVIVHFYTTNDGVPAGTYAVALYTPYQSYLLYLKKAGTEEQTNDAEIEKLYQEIDSLQASIQQLIRFYEERYTALYNEVQDLKKAQSVNDKDVAELETQLKTLNTQIQALQKQLDTLNKLALDMQKTVQANDKQVTAFDTKLKQYDKLLLEYDKKISVLDASLKQVDIEKYKQLDQRLSDLEQKVAKIEQATVDAKTLASQSSSQVSYISAKVGDMENKINYALIGAIGGVAALVLVFSNGNNPFKRENRPRRNGGLPRPEPGARGVPPSKAFRKAEQNEENYEVIEITPEKLKELLEDAKAQGQAEVLAEVFKTMVESENEGEEG